MSAKRQKLLDEMAALQAKLEAEDNRRKGVIGDLAAKAGALDLDDAILASAFRLAVEVATDPARHPAAGYFRSEERRRRPKSDVTPVPSGAQAKALPEPVDGPDTGGADDGRQS